MSASMDEAFIKSLAEKDLRNASAEEILDTFLKKFIS